MHKNIYYPISDKYPEIAKGGKAFDQLDILLSGVEELDDKTWLKIKETFQRITDSSEQEDFDSLQTQINKLKFEQLLNSIDLEPEFMQEAIKAADVRGSNSKKLEDLVKINVAEKYQKLMSNYLKSK